MTKQTRLEQGKLMKKQLEKGIKSHFKFDENHPYIKEYEASLEVPKTNSKKKKKVK